MSARSSTQLNIRSEAARRRVADLVRQTGKTATQIVEDALQAYIPPPPAESRPAPEGLMWHGRFLVEKSTGGPSITTDELLRCIDEARDDRIRHNLGEEVHSGR